MMFTKILIPTDGSPLGNQAAMEGIELAQKVGAEVIGVYVARESQNPAFDFSNIRPKNLPTAGEYKQAMMEAGELFLKPLQESANEKGVTFSKQIYISNAPAHQIVKAATENHCNLIFMGSNGCAGWSNILMGSVTSKVLSTSSIPVLVYKVKKESLPPKTKVQLNVIPIP